MSTTAHDFIPGGDRRFLEWLTIVVNYLKNMFHVWRIPENEQQNIEQLLATFTTAFGLVDNPQTHTPPAIRAKQSARNAAESGIRALLRAYVTNNPLVTDEDRRNMELPIHKTTRTHVAVPATRPLAVVEILNPAQVELHFKDVESSTNAKPAGVHGVEISWAILDAPTNEWDMLTHSAFDTHTPYVFTFSGKERGKTLYFALRWENTRGEKGPWSEIQSTIIP
jgi:hypothetical protein